MLSQVLLILLCGSEDLLSLSLRHGQPVTCGLHVPRTAMDIVPYKKKITNVLKMFCDSVLQTFALVTEF